jgi:hypothetical protein
MPIFLEPGESFAVEYSSGKSLQAVSLSLRGQQKVMALLVDGDSGDQLKKLQAAEQALRLCFPSITDEQLDSLNYNMALEVVGKALAATRLSSDEQKKSE